MDDKVCWECFSCHILLSRKLDLDAHSVLVNASYNVGPTSSDVEVQYVPVPEDLDLEVILVLVKVNIR